MDKNETESGRKTRRNKNVVCFWLDDEDYDYLTHLTQTQGVDRKKIFLDLLYRRYRGTFPILGAFAHVVAASLAIKDDGAGDKQIEKLRREVDRLALLALREVRATSDDVL